MTLMKSSSTRIRKRRAPQQQKPGSLKPPVPLRRSAWLQPKQRPTLIPQGLLEHRSTVPQRAQLQDQTHTHLTRKRGLDGSIDNSSERSSKRPRLTVKNLKRLENVGKPAGKGPTGQSRGSKLSGPLRESSDLETKSTRSKQTISATSKDSNKTVSSTDSRFPALILRNGIVEPPNSRRPTTFDHLQERLDRARETVSPTESEYQLAAFNMEIAENEQTMLLETSTLLKGHEQGYRRTYNQPFSDFPKNVGFNDGASAAQPDMVEGLNLTRFSPLPAREELGGAAVPSSGPNAITLPHLAGEWKGSGKDMNLARHQAAYDGASMVFSRNEARSFLGSPDPDGHAYVHTFTTDGTTLNTFAHYSSQSGGQVQYHQYPTSTSSLRASHEDFNTARRRLRNLQDIAKENSETLRDELINKWSASQQYIGDDDEEEEEDNNYDNYSSPHISPGIQTRTADPKYCNGYNYDDQVDGPGRQLLTEYYSSFTKDEDENEDGDESLVQIPTPDASSASKPRSKHKKKKRSRL